MVMARAMHVFLERVPPFTLAEGRIEWVPSSNFRSPVALPLLT
jgi:hypothetical protein